MKTPRKYRNGAIEVEAMHLNRENWGQVTDWLGESFVKVRTRRVQAFMKTADGIVCASEGDYVVKFQDGSFLPFKAEQFEASCKLVAA